MRIRPLTGQVLVSVKPNEEMSGSIVIPDTPSNPNDLLSRVQFRRGVVKEMGQWKRSKNGFGILPPFGIGAEVIIKEHSGQKLNFDIGHNLRLIKSEDILAVIVDS